MIQPGKFEADILTSHEQIIAALRRFKLDIEKALCYGNNETTYEQFCAKVLGGILDIYLFPNSIIVASVDKGEQHDTYHVYVACGDLNEILAFDTPDGIHKEAWLRNCSYVGFSGRAGWERPLSKMGWNNKLVTMYKEVAYEQEDK